jgi:hypothetical protein
MQEGQMFCCRIPLARRLLQGREPADDQYSRRSSGRACANFNASEYPAMIGAHAEAYVDIA